MRDPEYDAEHKYADLVSIGIPLIVIAYVLWQVALSVGK
jgi:hypothetical protein